MKTPLDKFPPFMCRVFAHRGRHPLPREEIAKKAGMSVRMVDRISRRATWCGMKVCAAFAFASACGVDLLHPRNAVRYLRHKKKAHWSASTRYELMYERLLKDGAKNMRVDGKCV